MNSRLSLSVESRVEIELETTGSSRSGEGLVVSEPLFGHLAERVCRSFEAVSDLETLAALLRLYSERVFACVRSIHSERARPQLLLLLGKSWVISAGLCRRIAGLGAGSSDDQRDLLLSVPGLLLSFLVFSGCCGPGERRLLLQDPRAKISLLEEVRLGWSLRALRLVRDWARVRGPSETSGRRCGGDKIAPRLQGEISLLDTVEQRVSAVLNLLSLSDSGSGGDAALSTSSYGLVLGLWSEYNRRVGSGDRLILQVIDTKSLPSKRLKCELLFTMTTLIDEESVFEDAVRLIISRTSTDHKVMHYICSRWGASLGDRAGRVSERLSARVARDHWRRMRTLMWELQVLAPLASETSSHLVKLQSVVLCYFLASELLVRTDETAHEHDHARETDFLRKVLLVLSEEVNTISSDSLLRSFVLERAVLPGAGAFSRGTVFSPSSFNLISSIASTRLETGVDKAVYYQLVSTMLSDSDVARCLGLDGAPLDILELATPLRRDCLTRLIYLFGQIPAELITSEACEPPETLSRLGFAFLDTFSPRPAADLRRYSNTLRLVSEYSGVIESVHETCRANTKTALLMLVDLAKKLAAQHLSGLREKRLSQDGQEDFYYSYVVLYKYISYWFEKHSSCIDAHAAMALKGVIRPQTIAPKGLATLVL